MQRSLVPVLAIAAIVLTVGVAFALIRAAPKPLVHDAEARARAITDTAAPNLGITAVLTAGDVSVERSLPALSFRLEPGQSLDAAIPAGAFRGEFAATFSSGRERRARIGAWIAGGSVIISHAGRSLVVDAAGDEPTLVMSREPVYLGSRPQQVTFDFTADADSPSSLRAMWQPEGATIALPLPAAGTPLREDAVVYGESLARSLHCAECHRSGDAVLQERLTSARAPDLRAVGTRARPAWLRAWLEDPQGQTPGTAMPALFAAGEPDRRERIEDLVHFIAMETGGFAEADPVDTSGLEATGRLLYHQVGCFACHGGLTEEADGTASSAHVSLGAIGAKMNLESLAAFLRDPVASRPAGQMPSLDLDEAESRSIAAYLLSRPASGVAAASETLRVDPQRAARGRTHFESVGCAACHELAVGGRPLQSSREARPLESLVGGDWLGGCVGAAPRAGAPHFALADADRSALRAFVESIPARQSHDLPLDHLASDILRLRCTSCHVYHGTGGPAPDVARHFSTIGEADLGDEGRLPPKLGDAGAKLNPAWLRQVFEESGRARPYLGARMPQYGAAAVAGFPRYLSAAAGVTHEPDDGPPFDVKAAESGRVLVGDAAMNCIQCHEIAGRPSTGTPGPDLAKMTERLRFDSFARWLHDPALVRPGTRMPSFFVSGRSAFTDHGNGEVDEQVRAIWSYLSQGELLPLPDGLLEPGGLNIDVLEEPVVFRTFMKQAGVRAIACGFPEQVHCAFDADTCRLALIWQGPFLSAKGAWAARGGSETDPESIAWTAPEGAVFVGADAAADGIARFRGYHLDGKGRPSFHYDVTIDGVLYEVVEQPVPVRRGLETGFSRRFRISGPPGAVLLVVHGAQRFRDGDGAFATRESGTTSVTLEGAGNASFQLEVSW